ncbi:prolipoprotein diacylglyceryl transferase [Paucilactobacillus hokkaidonensis JCM 18461]|uniref:Phosphatidylglycerol--prolipoprotein diacylglyceryl transferase n=2 Tax=Paucilactobacillus hokkaidonensis TaxID=1193095 RepID=A0A0A1GYX8_9LACO|nr:prolipoprotein diacylglyceryl transferase [Paucilactobacillus hokkaidonensis]KRO10187.1 prolipoprotein diacylglyceryl transferase [Paucilactobacillus hokkaidonensis]BAP86203.1 prolipoprotein diacylglyceryl transferase [Paucilactobacillus hokkaidonensis JCM 18461]
MQFWQSLGTAINPIALKLGPIQIHWYGVIIASAVIIALTLSVREGQRVGIESDNFYDYILWALPAAIIFARAYYVIFEWGYYSQHPAEIIAVWDGGIAIYGSLIGALLVMWFFCRSRSISIWIMLDVVAPTVILAQGIGRWGNFMNQEAFGKITSHAFLQDLHLPTFIINQMYISGAYRIPTFFYESCWDVLGFVVLIILRHRHHLFRQGEIFLSYVMWYSAGRFVIEGMRTDSLMIGNTIRVSQVLSVILFVGAIALFIIRRRHKYPWYLEIDATRK